MTLLYRAVWRDDRSDLVQAVGDAFVDWAAEKDAGDPLVLTPEWEPVTTPDGPAAVGSLREQQQDAIWLTTVRVAVDLGRDEQWIAVDVERTTDDAFVRHEIAAPRLVRSLIAEGIAANGCPRVGPVDLSGDAKGLTTAKQVTTEIIPLIEHGDRRTPLVFFSHDDREDPALTADRSHSAAEQLAGVARVYLLTTAAQDAFHEELGSELSVWGGGARMYLPGNMDPWRHRYLPWYAVQRHRREAGRRFARMLRNFSPATRLPPALDDLEQRLQATQTQSLEDRLADQHREVVRLRDELQRAESERLDAVQLAEDTQHEESALRLQFVAHLSNAKSGDASRDDLAWPPSVASFSQLVEEAKRHLHMLSIPGSAPREIDRLDDALEASVWAQKAWNGLCALHAYAESGERGGFVAWCKRGESPYTWSTSKGKLALHESETVMNNPALRAKRDFPILDEVGRASTRYMGAHLKIAEGGGQNIPRVYFDDDTSGPTGKVHIGFIGPHDLVPNTRRG